MESLKCTDHNPPGEESGRSTSQIDQIVQKAKAGRLSHPYLIKFICYKKKKNTLIDFSGCKVIFFSLVSSEQTVLMWPFQSFTNDLSVLSSTDSDVWTWVTDQPVPALWRKFPSIQLEQSELPKVTLTELFWANWIVSNQLWLEWSWLIH